MSNDPGKKPPGKPASHSATPAEATVHESRPAIPATTPPNTPRPARPQAPSRPVTGPRLEGVMYESQTDTIQSIDTIIPSGLSTSTYLPAARRNPEVERQLSRKRQYHFRQTILPSAFVLCVSSMLMGVGWFLLDPSSALRDNVLGSYIPMTLFALAAGFGGIGVLFAVQARSLREPDDMTIV